MLEQANQQPEPPEGYTQVGVKNKDGTITYHQAPTVDSLTAHGYKVIIHHKRYKQRRSEFKGVEIPRDLRRNSGLWEVKAKGGATHVLLLAPERDGWGEGHVVCVAGDPYSKRVGYVLAVNKALAQLHGSQ